MVMRLKLKWKLLLKPNIYSFNEILKKSQLSRLGFFILIKKIKKQSQPFFCDFLASRKAGFAEE